jgi:hypothetical protein
MTPARHHTYVVRRAKIIAGSALAGAALAAVTSFSALPAAATPVTDAVASSPGRIEGIHADLERAVALHQVTAEQASRFERRLAARITGEA